MNNPYTRRDTLIERIKQATISQDRVDAVTALKWATHINQLEHELKSVNEMIKLHEKRT